MGSAESRLEFDRVVVTGGSGFLGTATCRALSSRHVSVLNLDIAPPSTPTPGIEWAEVDVLNADSVSRAVLDFRAEALLHLAARVDIEGTTPAEYDVNVRGTANALHSAREAETRRFVFVSTQFVTRPGHVPVADADYSPHTAYGESKARAEDIVRAASDMDWVIVRPTTVWGPGDLGYRRQFYRAMDRGWYLHPKGRPARRSYGYVGNVVGQILGILGASREEVTHQTFYVGDPVADITDFVDEFSLQMKGVPARRVPLGVLRGVGAVGDVLASFGFRAPLTSRRLRSMIEDYVVPVDETALRFGDDNDSLEESVRETLRWLRSEGVVAGAVSNVAAESPQ